MAFRIYVDKGWGGVSNWSPHSPSSPELLVWSSRAVAKFWHCFLKACRGGGEGGYYGGGQDIALKDMIESSLG